MVKQTLLIIDDSPDTHELVRLWLEDGDLAFHSCYDGEQGLTVASELRPDLILLDVDLPGLDGFEICRRLKASPATIDIPVVFLTGASTTEEKLRGLELGAIDYVIKPFDPAELRARVTSSLNTKRLMNLLAEKAQTLAESEERFRVLAENSSDVISRHDSMGMYLYASPAATTILGIPSEQLQGRTFIEFVHPQDAEAVRTCFTSRVSTHEAGTVEFRFRRSDGQYVWLESTCRALMDGAGRVREVHASARDIHGRKQMEAREEVRADVLEMIAQGRPLSNILRHLIDSAESQEPTAIAAGVMLNAATVEHCAPHLPPTISASIERHMYTLINRFADIENLSGERIIACDLMNDESWQELRPELIASGLVSCWSVLIRSHHREVSGCFSLYRRDYLKPQGAGAEMLKLAGQLTSVAVEHRQLTERLTFQAMHDALTGLPNRAMFNDALERAIALAKRNGRPIGVLLIDVDRFKHVNDTYGHQAGDEMLCQVAHRLRTRLRSSDILARMGGDEFAAILQDLNAVEDADAVAKTLVAELHEPIDLQGRKQFVTVSIGSAVFPGAADDSATLLKFADIALYNAKDRGRNAASAFVPELNDGVSSRMELESELRQAVELNQLRLHYQAKVDRHNQIVGVEALVRWNHPKLGLVPPGKFIPLAEDSGMIIQIGTWVIEEAARQACQWRSQGLPAIPIAVNVSALQFAQPEFIRTVTAILKEAGLPAGWLQMELTESLLMRNIREAVDKLSEVHKLGISVAIDDFGTGYSSLAYLQQLSIDTLKIDHSFVCTITPPTVAKNDGSVASGQIIVGAIIALAKSLNLQVIAEGVETALQRDFLLNIGCDQLQGYLFGTPRPADQMTLALRQQLIGTSQSAA